MELLNKIAYVLVIIGGLNWGLVIFDKNLVEILPGVLPEIVYALVALSALLLIFVKCDKKKKAEPAPEPMAQEPMDGPSM